MPVALFTMGLECSAKKTGPAKFINFVRPGLAESVRDT